MEYLFLNPLSHPHGPASPLRYCMHKAGKKEGYSSKTKSDQTITTELFEVILVTYNNKVEGFISDLGYFSFVY